MKRARWFSFSEVDKCTNKFSVSNEIGVGGYGKVKFQFYFIRDDISSYTFLQRSKDEDSKTGFPFTLCRSTKEYSQVDKLLQSKDRRKVHHRVNWNLRLKLSCFPGFITGI